MKISVKNMSIIIGVALILTIIISNVVKAGKALDSLRSDVLRMHILANSDGVDDQNLKLEVRDAILENSEDIFGKPVSLSSAIDISKENLDKICDIAQGVVNDAGYDYIVSVEEAKMYFDERIYGDITMPSGNYNAIRVNIGEAEGKNWWCVMYPPLCIPMASEVVEDEAVKEEFFTEEQQDIMEKPQKYKVRFMIWDKVMELIS